MEIFVNPIDDKSLIYALSEELQPNKRKPSIQFKTLGRTWTDLSPKKQTDVGEAKQMYLYQTDYYSALKMEEGADMYSMVGYRVKRKQELTGWG